MAPPEVDVLIVGAGPAGLMLSLWLSRLGITTRIVDKRTGKVFSGQADGFQVRTLEMLDSFGIGERVWKEANHMIGEYCFPLSDIGLDLTRRRGLLLESRLEGRDPPFFSGS